MADQQLLEAETPSQVLVLSGVTPAAFLTFSNGFWLIRSRVAIVYQVLHNLLGTVFYASLSFRKSRIFFALQVMLRWKEGLGEGRLTFRWPQFVPSYHGGFGNPPPPHPVYLSELLKA